MDEDKGLPPILRLHVEIGHAPKAMPIGNIIARLPMAYSNYLHRVSPDELGAKLRLDQLTTGSIIADFIAVGEALDTLWQHRSLLSGFVQHLADILEIITGVRPGKASNSDRHTIEVLANPVASDGARQVSVQVIGDNNVVLIITPREARLLGDIAQQRAPERLKSAQGQAKIAAEDDPQEVLGLDGILAFYPSANKWLVWINNSGTFLPVDPGGLTTRGKLRRDSEYEVLGSIMMRGGEPRAFRISRILH